VKPMPAMPGMPPNLPAHVAMTDTLIGLAIGSGEETTLKAAMTSDPKRQPLLVMGYSGAAFVQFAEQMKQSISAIEDPAQRAESERSMDMMLEMYKLIRRAEMQVEFDESGIVLYQSAEMN
jgi:hypothetical protein